MDRKDKTGLGKILRSDGELYGLLSMCELVEKGSVSIPLYNNRSKSKGVSEPTK